VSGKRCGGLKKGLGGEKKMIHKNAAHSENKTGTF